MKQLSPGLSSVHPGNVLGGFNYHSATFPKGVHGTVDYIPFDLQYFLGVLNRLSISTTNG